MIWTDKWPRTEGAFWFHGYLYGEDKKDAATHLVKTFFGAKSLVCITEGQFMYESDGVRGVWTPAIIPAPIYFK